MMVMCMCLSCIGSPSHVWRIRVFFYAKKLDARITSTCVENTLVPEDLTVTLWDHLHMCGEYSKQIPL